jgi:hypothetical protein
VERLEERINRINKAAYFVDSVQFQFRKRHVCFIRNPGGLATLKGLHVAAIHAPYSKRFSSNPRHSRAWRRVGAPQEFRKRSGFAPASRWSVYCASFYCCLPHGPVGVQLSRELRVLLGHHISFPFHRQNVLWIKDTTVIELGNISHVPGRTCFSSAISLRKRST